MSNSWLSKIAKAIPAGPTRDKLRGAYWRSFGRWERREIAMRLYRPKLKLIDKWAKLDAERANFYYEVTPNCRDHIVSLVAHVTDRDYATIDGYCRELEGDTELLRHLQSAMQNSGYGMDIKIAYGRRIGWYAFVRARKPEVVVETGVDHGVGACVLTSALIRNGEEGRPGRYWGTDIRPEAGKLLVGKFAEVGTVLVGDSAASLRAFDKKIDLFINDSDHHVEYEDAEYVEIESKLSERAIILSDNAHRTDCLSRFARATGRSFLFVEETPLNHWFPGAGIGVAF